MPAFITAEEFHELDDVIRDGWQTLQAWYEPAPITIRRRSGNGWVDVETLTPIRIRLGGRMELTGLLNQGVSEIANAGTMRVYTPNSIKRDDRFKIGDDTFVIGLVEDDDNHGSQVINFTVLEG